MEPDTNSPPSSQEDSEATLSLQEETTEARGGDQDAGGAADAPAGATRGTSTEEPAPDAPPAPPAPPATTDNSPEETNPDGAVGEARMEAAPGGTGAPAEATETQPPATTAEDLGGAALLAALQVKSESAPVTRTSAEVELQEELQRAQAAEEPAQPSVQDFMDFMSMQQGYFQMALDQQVKQAAAFDRQQRLVETLVAERSLPHTPPGAGTSFPSGGRVNHAEITGWMRSLDTPAFKFSGNGRTIDNVMDYHDFRRWWFVNLPAGVSPSTHLTYLRRCIVNNSAASSVFLGVPDNRTELREEHVTWLWRTFEDQFCDPEAVWSRSIELIKMRQHTPSELPSQFYARLEAQQRRVHQFNIREREVPDGFVRWLFVGGLDAALRREVEAHPRAFGMMEDSWRDGVTRAFATTLDGLHRKIFPPRASRAPPGVSATQVVAQVSAAQAPATATAAAAVAIPTTPDGKKKMVDAICKAALDQGRHTNWTKEQDSTLRKLGACLRCGELGHVLKDCSASSPLLPNFDKRRAAQRQNNESKNE